MQFNNMKSELKKNLTQFGLNSDDWRLIPLSEETCLIQQPTPDGLLLRGFFDKEGVWKRIEFLDILSEAN